MSVDRLVELADVLRLRSSRYQEDITSSSQIEVTSSSHFAPTPPS